MLRMQHSSARKIKSTVLIILTVLISLLGILNASIQVSADDYPNDKNQCFPFWNSKVTEISWSNMSRNYTACAWDDINSNIEFGLINKTEIGKNFSFVYKKPVTIDSHYTIDMFADPSVIYLDNGVVILILIMHHNGDDPQYNGVLEMNSTNNGTTWNAPFYLSSYNPSTSQYIEFLHLVALNSSAFAVFWEENYSYLVYRISLNRGSTWGPKQILIPNTNDFNFCYRNDGSITLIMCLPNEQIPSALELPRDPANWNQSMPVLLNYANNGGEANPDIPINILTFKEGTYLYNTGVPGNNKIFFHVISTNLTSQEFTMQFNSTGTWIASMFKVDSSQYIVFYNDNAASKCYYLYANNFDPWAPQISPIVIFIIVIVAILGLQVILFYIHSKLKKRQAINANQTDTSIQDQQLQTGEKAIDTHESKESSSSVEEQYEIDEDNVEKIKEIDTSVQENEELPNDEDN